MTPDEIAQRVGEYKRHALARFPLRLIEVSGEQALAEWERLRSAGQGYPVVLGPEDERGTFGNLLTPFGPKMGELRSVDDILQTAASIQLPGDLAALHRARFEAVKERWPDLEEASPPEIGLWPDTPPEASALQIARNVLTGVPHQSVYIGLAPTDDWTTIPALLRWGNWNECPPPEYHVAALRMWRDQYGAELVSLTFDTMELRVKRNPQSRDEALELARQQAIYCEDIVSQGVGTLSALAAERMANEWWLFWWD